MAVRAAPREVARSRLLEGNEAARYLARATHVVIPNLSHGFGGRRGNDPAMDTFVKAVRL
jgi:hypothetical protein